MNVASSPPAHSTARAPHASGAQPPPAESPFELLLDIDSTAMESGGSQAATQAPQDGKDGIDGEPESADATPDAMAVFFAVAAMAPPAAPPLQVAAPLRGQGDATSSSPSSTATAEPTLPAIAVASDGTATALGSRPDAAAVLADAAETTIARTGKTVVPPPDLDTTPNTTPTAVDGFMFLMDSKPTAGLASETLAAMQAKSTHADSNPNPPAPRPKGDFTREVIPTTPRGPVEPPSARRAEPAVARSARGPKLDTQASPVMARPDSNTTNLRAGDSAPVVSGPPPQRRPSAHPSGGPGRPAPEVDAAETGPFTDEFTFTDPSTDGPVDEFNPLRPAGVAGTADTPSPRIPTSATAPLSAHGAPAGDILQFTTAPAVERTVVMPVTASPRPAMPGDVAPTPPPAPSPMAAAAPWASRIELALDEAASQAESILRQVRMHVRQGMTELQLRLDPPALGELRMRLVFDAGRLRARVRTTEAATADLVKSKSGELKSAMQAAGIDITELDIATSESGGRRRKFTLSDMQELSGRTPGAPANPAPARAVAGERPPLRSASAGLDLFV